MSEPDEVELLPSGWPTTRRRLTGTVPERALDTVARALATALVGSHRHLPPWADATGTDGRWEASVRTTALLAEHGVTDGDVLVAGALLPWYHPDFEPAGSRWRAADQRHELAVLVPDGFGGVSDWATALVAVTISAADWSTAGPTAGSAARWLAGQPTEIRALAVAGHLVGGGSTVRAAAMDAVTAGLPEAMRVEALRRVAPDDVASTPAGSDAVAVQTTGLEPSGARSTGPEPAGAAQAGAQPAGTEPAGVGPEGTGTADADAAGAEPQPVLDPGTARILATRASQGRGSVGRTEEPAIGLCYVLAEAQSVGPLIASESDPPPPLPPRVEFGSTAPPRSESYSRSGWLVDRLTGVVTGKSLPVGDKADPRRLPLPPGWSREPRMSIMDSVGGASGAWMSWRGGVQILTTILQSWTEQKDHGSWVRLVWAWRVGAESVALLDRAKERDADVRTAVLLLAEGPVDEYPLVAVTRSGRHRSPIVTGLSAEAEMLAFQAVRFPSTRPSPPPAPPVSPEPRVSPAPPVPDPVLSPLPPDRRESVPPPAPPSPDRRESMPDNAAPRLGPYVGAPPPPPARMKNDPSRIPAWQLNSTYPPPPPPREGSRPAPPIDVPPSPPPWDHEPPPAPPWDHRPPTPPPWRSPNDVWRNPVIHPWGASELGGAPGSAPGGGAPDDSLPPSSSTLGRSQSASLSLPPSVHEPVRPTAPDPGCPPPTDDRLFQFNSGGGGFLPSYPDSPWDPRDDPFAPVDPLPHYLLFPEDPYHLTPGPPVTPYTPYQPYPPMYSPYPQLSPYDPYATLPDRNRTVPPPDRTALPAHESTSARGSFSSTGGPPGVLISGPDRIDHLS
ncbi:MAG: hypothetical protein WCA46_11605, partial [Actinocatenispora sp.]